ncbi:MAG: methylmalonyl-CoA mutase family protein [Bacteroidales bacterium]|nr:methylmalonyl-CoA mutase family protein [Bacteroidales bacterium]MDD4669635.1 methylmalonyl-CoA mutase family protein [Bacteroidales bacterium]
MANKLFTEFPPVSTEQWEEVIIKDLKGADYEKKLVWRTQEGFNVRPYYRAEDLKNLKYMGSEPGVFPFVRGTKKDNDWFIHQGICCCDNDFARANKEAKVLLSKGVESLGFYIDDTKVQTKEDYALLLNGISLSKVPVSFCGCCLKTAESLKNFLKYVDSLEIDKEAIRAIFDFNPLMVLTTKGYFCEDKAFGILADCVKAVEQYKNIRVIAVDAFTFNGAGASSVQELAFALAEGSEYLSRLTELGVSVKEVAKRMTFSFAVGSNYFMEIAKFRAARLLWANIVESYGTESNCAKKMNIVATTSEWNQTVYDAYVNMLRATTEAMSAAIAGVNYLEVVPYDFAFRVPTDFSNRIARNVQNILKEESHFNKVVDPAAGSYYIENLTNSLANAAWDLFKKIEDGGGYVVKFKEGFIQSEIKAVSDKKDKNIATRRETLLGTNQYPNFLEKADECITKEIVSRDIPTMMGATIECKSSCQHPDAAEPLKPYRGAEAFEALRLATDRSGKEPKAFMLTFGNLAMCRARAQFSSNFFAVAGIKVVDNNRFATIEEGVEAAIEAKADIVVACSSDDEYAEAVPQIAELLGNKAVLVVAGDPECREALTAKGITNFINVKCNVLETLKDYQQLLGIKEL